MMRPLLTLTICGALAGPGVAFAQQTAAPAPAQAAPRASGALDLDTLLEPPKLDLPPMPAGPIYVEVIKEEPKTAPPPPNVELAKVRVDEPGQTTQAPVLMEVGKDSKAQQIAGSLAVSVAGGVAGGAVAGPVGAFVGKRVAGSVFGPKYKTPQVEVPVPAAQAADTATTHAAERAAAPELAETIKTSNEDPSS